MIKIGGGHFLLKKLIILVLLLCSVFINSESVSYLDDLSATYQIRKNGQKYIYLDDEKAFDSITPFTNGYSIVSSAGRFGVINAEGTQVLPCIYDLIEFAEDCFIIQQDGRKGLSDQTGKILIEPSYAELDYHDGTAAVCYWWSDCGIVDKNNQLIIPMKYENAGPFENEWAMIQEKETYRVNYINRNGELLFPNWLTGAASINGDYAIGCPDFSHSILINMKTKEVENYPSANVIFLQDGLILVEGSTIFSQKEDTTKTAIKLYDIREDTYVSLEYDTIQPFTCGLAAVCNKGKWGYINEDFELVIPLKYTQASRFSEERAWVEIDGKWAVINLQGHVVFYDEEKTLLDSCVYSEGLAAIETRNGWGFIDKAGNVVCEPQYQADSSIVEFHDGLCNLFIFSPYEAHYIDHSFQTIIEYDIYDMIPE